VLPSCFPAEKSAAANGSPSAFIIKFQSIIWWWRRQTNPIGFSTLSIDANANITTTRFKQAGQVWIAESLRGRPERALLVQYF
jgi:hypothetical protein